MFQILPVLWYKNVTSSQVLCWSESFYVARIHASSQANVKQLVKYFLLCFVLRLDCRIVLIHPDKNHFIAICYKQSKAEFTCERRPQRTASYSNRMRTFSPAYYSMFVKFEDVWCSSSWPLEVSRLPLFPKLTRLLVTG